jgi:hypothetical protein
MIAEESVPAIGGLAHYLMHYAGQSALDGIYGILLALFLA